MSIAQPLQLNVVIWIFISAFLSCYFPYQPALANINVQDGAPRGFEQLEAPRQTAVILSYGGDVIGTFPAHFSPGILHFDKPEEIAAKILTLKNPEKIIAALQQPLSAHADLLCPGKAKENCGQLKPVIIGIIFNENQLSAELFINPTELAVVDADANRFLPLPERHLSSVVGFNGAVSGAANQSTDYTFTNNAVIASGEARLETQTTAASQGFRFDTFAGDVERRGWDATGGLFRSEPMQLLSDRDIAGLSLKTSTHTYLDGHKTEGNDIIVALPRRSFVAIYREGRLYSSRNYDAGNQRLDTSELPDGAYPITLKIQDSDGTVREETRFFAKTAEIPPPGQPIYYAQMGFVRQTAAQNMSTVPQITHHPIARLGAVERLNDNLGLNLNLLGTTDRAVTESGLFWLGRGQKLGGTILASTQGDYGVQSTYLYYLERFSTSLDARKLWMSPHSIPGFEDQSRNFMQLSGSANYAVTKMFDLGLRGNYSRQNSAIANTSYGPHAEWRIWQQNASSLTFSADATCSNKSTDGAMLLNFTMRFGDYGVTGSGGAGLVASQFTPLVNARVFHDDETPDNSLLLGAGMSADNHQRIANADGNWKNHFAQLQGSVQKAFGQNNSTLSYGGNFNVSAAQLGNQFHLGGNNSEKSAVMVDVSGDAGTDMKIFVNGTPRTTVQVGDRQVIYLSPFNTYRIHITPSKPGLLDYQAGDRKITLYPGNVVKLFWQVNKFYVVAARIITLRGQPLANAALQESRAQISTNDTGRLQAELAAPKILTFNASDNTQCRVFLPADVKPKNGVLIYPNALTCQPTNQIAFR